MKVKIFSASFLIGLEEKINKFIINKEVIDIKFQAYEKFMLVIIIYKENPNDN